MSESALPNLETLRILSGLSRKELGAKLGLAERSIGRYENGESEPGLSELKKMAAFFGVTVAYLIGESEDSQALRRVRG